MVNAPTMAIDAAGAAYRGRTGSIMSIRIWPVLTVALLLAAYSGNRSANGEAALVGDDDRRGLFTLVPKSERPLAKANAASPSVRAGGAGGSTDVDAWFVSCMDISCRTAESGRTALV